MRALDMYKSKNLVKDDIALSIRISQMKSYTLYVVYAFKTGDGSLSNTH